MSTVRLNKNECPHVTVELCKIYNADSGHSETIFLLKQWPLGYKLCGTALQASRSIHVKLQKRNINNQTLPAFNTIHTSCEQKYNA